MNCEQVQERLTQYLLGDLDTETCAVVREHLAKCDGCRAAAQDIEPTLDLLRDALAASSPMAARLSRDVREKVRLATKPAAGQFDWWILRHHRGLAAAAAVLLVFGAIWGMLVSSHFGVSRGKAINVMLDSMEAPQMLVEESAEGQRWGFKARSPRSEVNGAVPLASAPVRGEHEEAFKADGWELGAGLGSAFKRDVSGAPAEVDSVNIVKSPARANNESGLRQPDDSSIVSGGEGRRVDFSFEEQRDQDGDGLSDSFYEYDKSLAGKPGSGSIRSSREALPGGGTAGFAKPVTPAPKPAMPDLQDTGMVWSDTDGRALRELAAPMDRPVGTVALQKKVQLGRQTEAMTESEPPPASRRPQPSFTLGDVGGDVGGRKRLVDAKAEKGMLADVRHIWELKSGKQSTPDEAPLMKGRHADELKVDANALDDPFAEAVDAEEVSDSGAFGLELKTTYRDEDVRADDSRSKARAVTSDDYGRDTLERLSLPQAKIVSKSYIVQPSVEETIAIGGKSGEFRTLVGKDKDLFFRQGGQKPVVKNNELQPAAASSVSEVPLVGDMPVVGSLFLSGNEGDVRKYEGKEKKGVQETSKSTVTAGSVLTLGPGDSDESDIITRTDDVLSPVNEKLQPVSKEAEELERRQREESAREEEDDAISRFRAAGVNPFLSAVDAPFSTFAIDVDTAAYTLARNYMNRGTLPPAESVRTEEFVNFFDYDYRPPVRDTFGINIEAAPSQFGRGLYLLKLGIKGRRLGREEQRRAVLTFLVDTSGSMEKADRIGLVKKALAMLVGELAPHDLVAIVQYGAEANLVLEHTEAARKDEILQAVDALQCGGSTNLEKGMRRAYGVAAQAFVGGGENRVLLLSDGVANLGTASAQDILNDVERFRKQGITCSVFGFGMGTYDDVMLETLANKGDGTYTFIDSEQEAKRIFVDDLSATLNTIATDVKIQVEFKSNRIGRYRQLGYENRQLKKEDFRNDSVDAGEVGSGQAVTALYELELLPTLYTKQVQSNVRREDPLAIVRVRYRRTDTGEIEEIERPVLMKDLVRNFDKAPVRFRLAACVAEFSEILRGSPFAAGSEFSDVASALRPIALDLNLDTRVQELLRMVQGANGMSRGQ